jgi:hypothetical protein
MLEDRCLPAVRIISQFPGLDYNAARAGQPPDTDLAVGPAHVVETVNLTLAFYNKTTGGGVFSQPLSQFFAPAGASSSMSDPVVTYDELAGRFVVGVLEFNFTSQTAFLDVAFSNDADPTHGFGLMRRIDIREFNGSEVLWGDYPKVGWNADADVFTVNMYAFSGPYRHVQVITIDKSFANVYRTDRSDPADFTLAATTMHGAVPGGPMWLVEENNNSSNLRLVLMNNLLSPTPSFADFVIAVTPYQQVVPPLQPNGQAITTNIGTWFLNAASRNGTLVASHNVGGNGVTHARWYEFDIHGNPALVQSGDVDQGPGIYTYFPAIDISPVGNLGLSFLESSNSEFMSMYVTGRTAADSAGSMQHPVLVKAGEANYNGSRAGDFSGISVDPGDGSLWAANEFANTEAPRNWGTWIARFEPIFDGGGTRQSYFAVGTDAGGVSPSVRVFDAQTHALVREFFAYDVFFTGGVRVAVANLFGDGASYVITAPGPGASPEIRIFEAATGRLIRSFLAYDAGFQGGVYIAVGDVNGDGTADIITGADAGGGPHVKVFNGRTGSVLYSFMAYDPGFGGGVRVAAGDIDGDGKADIITGAGPGGGPHVKVFSGANGAMIRSFFAYASSFTGGVYVAAGDTTGHGRADIITGAGAASHVEVFSGANLAVLHSFFAYDLSFLGGVRVATLAGPGGRVQILTAAGTGGGPHLKVYDGLSRAVLDSFFAFDPFYLGGIFVGGRL